MVIWTIPEECLLSSPQHTNHLQDRLLRNGREHCIGDQFNTLPLPTFMVNLDLTSTCQVFLEFGWFVWRIAEAAPTTQGKSIDLTNKNKRYLVQSVFRRYLQT